MLEIRRTQVFEEGKKIEEEEKGRLFGGMR